MDEINCCKLAEMICSNTLSACRLYSESTLDLLVSNGKTSVSVDVASLDNSHADGFDRILAEDNIVGLDKDSFVDKVAVAGVAQCSVE